MPFTPTNNPTFMRQPNRQGCQLTTTAGGVVYTAGPNGSKITGLFATSNDIVPEELQVNLVSGTAPNQIVQRLITTSVQPGAFDLLKLIPGLPRDHNGNHYLTLAIGDVLAAQVVAISAGAAINIFAIGGDY